MTFLSLGTFDSLWRRVEQEMAVRHLHTERRWLEAYIAERPSAEGGRGWLHKLGFERVVGSEYSLELVTGHGQAFLYDPLLRGGFLDDVYECFEDPKLADEFMTTVSEDVPSFML